MAEPRLAKVFEESLIGLALPLTHMVIPGKGEVVILPRTATARRKNPKKT